MTKFEISLLCLEYSVLGKIMGNDAIIMVNLCLVYITMNNVFEDIKKITDSLSLNYNLDVTTFFVIYLISIVPFYLGYFLMIYGTTRKLKWNDVFNLRVVKEKVMWNGQATTGLIVHLFGRIMPYFYIALVGKNLPILLIVVVWGVIIVSVIYGIVKIFFGKTHRLPENIYIERHGIIKDSTEVERLWSIYNETFEPLNRMSPCKQSLDHEHFIDALHDESVFKFILCKKGFGYVGLVLITNNFINTPWISPDYFEANYFQAFRNNHIYYFMGIAVLKEFRGNRYSLSLLEHVIDDLPKNAVIGFDHSININPALHYFTRVIKQSRLVRRTHIDRQHYHVVEYKNAL